jgi:hypothetical protein
VRVGHTNVVEDEGAKLGHQGGSLRLMSVWALKRAGCSEVWWAGN